jgi:hypothetical protein
LLVIGTTSEASFLESIGMCDVFSVTYHVPKLKEDAKKVMKHSNLYFLCCVTKQFLVCRHNVRPLGQMGYILDIIY